MTGIVVQARMGSTRLPGKVMLSGAGKPMLGHLLERLQRVSQFDRLIVATSVQSADDVIEDYCRSVNVPVFRGSERDVLDRYYQAAKHFGLQTIVRVTSDCPLIDPGLIDDQLRFFAAHQQSFDLVTNRHPLTYPDGLDFDIMSMQALTHVWTHATAPAHREHTVPYFWEKGMRVHNFEDPQRLFAKHRWTLDYPEDYELIRTILAGLLPERPAFSTQDILLYLDKHPHLPFLNARYIQ